MKLATGSALAIGILCSAVGVSYAAPKKPPSYEQCSKLANDRGYAVSERGSTRRIFIERCMKGEMQ